jgi:hypothetical protein
LLFHVTVAPAIGLLVPLSRTVMVVRQQFAALTIPVKLIKTTNETNNVNDIDFDAILKKYYRKVFKLFATLQ